MTKHMLSTGLVLVISCALCSIVAGTALGAEYIYKVNKTQLGVGQAKEITLAAKTTQTLSSEISGFKGIVKCKGLKLDKAEGPVIKGGVPGTSTKDRFEFSECEASVAGTKCKGVEVEGGTLQGEIVTVVQPSAEAGDLATKFSGTGGAFVRIDFKDCVLGLSFRVVTEGAIVLRDIPEKTEQKVGTLLAGAGTEEITEIEKSTGTMEKVELKCEKARASFEGSSELALVNEESWGVF